jgi:hypothetical protein
VEPDGTAVTSVSVEVDFSVVCSDPGQLISPDDSQLTPVRICVLVSVVVVRALFAKKPKPLVVVAAADEVVVELAFVTQISASVV